MCIRDRFTPFSRYIAENKDAYYKAYERVERNVLISGYTDVTPFLFYFCNEVYNRLQVDAVPPKTDLELSLIHIYVVQEAHLLSVPIIIIAARTGNKSTPCTAPPDVIKMCIRDSCMKKEHLVHGRR